MLNLVQGYHRLGVLSFCLPHNKRRDNKYVNSNDCFHFM